MESVTTKTRQTPISGSSVTGRRSEASTYTNAGTASAHARRVAVHGLRVAWARAGARNSDSAKGRPASGGRGRGGAEANSATGRCHGSDNVEGGGGPRPPPPPPAHEENRERQPHRPPRPPPPPPPPRPPPPCLAPPP